MRRSLWLSVALGLALIGAQTASATDYWDLATDPDNDASTDNELVHGTSQQHDLQNNGGATDEDWFIVISYPRSSYEALVDSTSGDLNMFNANSFNRIDPSGTVVLQNAEYANPGGGTGYSVALRWVSAGTTIEEQFLRVRSTFCGGTCGSEDQYHIRFRETTIAVPRFNNAGGQTTVLIVQNTVAWPLPPPPGRAISGTAYFWSGGGVLLGSSNFSLTAKQALVLNTSTVAGVAGQSGTITIAHDGGYGGLAVKSVALEPATGFSFDSPGTYKPD